MLLEQTGATPFHKATGFVNECLDLIRHAFCQRCHNTDQNQHKSGNKKQHNLGRIYTHLLGQDLREDEFVRWEDDTEHGLFHGLSACLMAGLVVRNEFGQIDSLIDKGGELLFVKEKNLRWGTEAHDVTEFFDPDTYSDYKSQHADDPLSFEGLVASCLLHDFLKVNGFDQAEHDVLLREKFPRLLEVTYTHSSPPHHKHPLLIADVLELQRYPDHKQWYKPDVIDGLLGKKQADVADAYYRWIRPALEAVYRHRNSPWFRHGPERPQDVSVPKYPQHAKKYVAVEIDRLPFHGCFEHDTGFSAAPWAFIKGVMSFDTFKRVGGDCKPSTLSPRDHLFADFGTATFDDWVFVVDQRSAVQNQPWPHEFFRQLIDGGFKVVDSVTLSKFMELSTLITDRVKIMNYCLDNFTR